MPFTTWRLQITGAATTLFDVKTAVPKKEGPVFEIKVKSKAPVLLSPATHAAPTKP
jgi:hypothetical protein